MSVIAETYFHLKLNFGESDLLQVKDYLESVALPVSDSIFDQKLKVHVTVEEGSLRSWLTLTGSIYAAVATYGSFRSGIDYIVEDSRNFSDGIIKRFYDDAEVGDTFFRKERRLGTPGRIKRFYEYLEDGVDDKKLENRYNRIILDLNSELDRDHFHSSLPQHIRAKLPLPEPQKNLKVKAAVGHEEMQISSRLPSNQPKLPPLPRK